jgi:hypothetical protein
MNSYGIKETNPDTLQHYGAYFNNSVADQFEIFSTDTSDEKKTLSELKKCFEKYILLLASSDDQ